MPEQETIDLTPDYDALLKRYKESAIATLEGFARKSATTLTRKEVYDFICTFRIAMGVVRTNEQFVALRDDFDKAADKVYERILIEQNM